MRQKIIFIICGIVGLAVLIDILFHPFAKIGEPAIKPRPELANAPITFTDQEVLDYVRANPFGNMAYSTSIEIRYITVKEIKSLYQIPGPFLGERLNDDRLVAFAKTGLKNSFAFYVFDAKSGDLLVKSYIIKDVR
jgi:hypothetical protein